MVQVIHERDVVSAIRLALEPGVRGIDIIRVNVVTGQVVIRGMFTHRALTQPCRHLPILRRTLASKYRRHPW